MFGQQCLVYKTLALSFWNMMFYIYFIVIRAVLFERFFLSSNDTAPAVRAKRVIAPPEIFLVIVK